MRPEGGCAQKSRRRLAPRASAPKGCGAIRQTRLLLWFTVISAVLLLPFALSGKHMIIGLLCITTNFLAGLGGASMAGRTLGLSLTARLFSLVFSIVPIVNALPALMLLTKTQDITELPGNQADDETFQVGEEVLRPIDAPPSLTTLNGFGFKLYGSSDYDPGSDSFMTTHYLTVFFLPLLPIARYRVISEDGYTYQFLGKGNLRGFDRVHLAIVILAVLLMVAKAQ